MANRMFKVALAFQIALPHHERIIRGIMDYARDHGPWEFAFDPEASQVTLASLSDWVGDGALTMIVDPEEAEFARRLPYPVVNLSATLQKPGLPTVTNDDYRIGELAAQHFLARGFRRFGFYGLHDVWYSIQRQRGFVERIEQAGFSCDILNSVGSAHVARPWTWNRPELEQWIASLKPPVGILAVHDYRARMVKEVALAMGKRVPEDVAVMGVNDDPVACETCRPTLTSIPHDGYNVGYRAAELLNRLMTGQPVGDEPILIPPNPISERQSTNALGVDDPHLRAAIDWLQQRMSDPVSVDDVADAVGISRRWLEQLFRSQLGVSPHDFLTSIRVDMAKALLRADSPLKLREVARRCGFHDARRLTIVFRQRVGMSPKQYRIASVHRKLPRR